MEAVFRLHREAQRRADELAGTRTRVHFVLAPYNFSRDEDDAGAELAKIYGFLGLDPSFRPDGIDRPVNAARAKKDDLSAETRAALVDAYTPDVRHLLTLGLGVER